MKGRPRQPTETLKLHGKYRADRHGERNEPEATGVPVKPDDMFPEASAYWDSIIGQVTWARQPDTVALRVMCEQYGLYRKALALAVVDPLDKEVRIAVLGYKAAWETLAARFGLTPADRARVSAEPAGKQSGVKTRQRA
jgi:phage terminase small subunit